MSALTTPIVGAVALQAVTALRTLLRHTPARFWVTLRGVPAMVTDAVRLAPGAQPPARAEP